jgi:hypothetical protein
MEKNSFLPAAGEGTSRSYRQNRRIAIVNKDANISQQSADRGGLSSRGTARRASELEPRLDRVNGERCSPKEKLPHEAHPRTFCDEELEGREMRPVGDVGWMKLGDERADQ